ncbi:hypothetical protein YC2023_018974 [Brassica napus]
MTAALVARVLSLSLSRALSYLEASHQLKPRNEESHDGCDCEEGEEEEYQNRFDGLASYRLEKSLLAQFIDMKIAGNMIRNL